MAIGEHHVENLTESKSRAKKNNVKQGIVLHFVENVTVTNVAIM